MYLFLSDKSSHVFSAITFTTSTHPLMRFPMIQRNKVFPLVSFLHKLIYVFVFDLIYYAANIS